MTGNGSSEPKGFLDYTIAAEGWHGVCQIGIVPGDFTDEDAADHLIDLL